MTYLDKDYYTEDKIRAVDAKFEAQKIAFSPLTFGAVDAMLKLGILKAVEEAGDEGLTTQELIAKTKVSPYGIGVLRDIALGMKILLIKEDSKLVLAKIGWMLLEDELTRVNFNFTRDVCYNGAAKIEQSIREGKPLGLSAFGDKWSTVYEALAYLPPDVQRSWFDFDHFYSDIAFPEALPIVFQREPLRLMDIGGNTAKWAIACARYNPKVSVTILDLPGQVAMAKDNVAKAGFTNRIDFLEQNILDEKATLPTGYDALWMSQFLDCFSPAMIQQVFKKLSLYVTPDTDVYVLEPLWDKQRFAASAYALQATSLYFTCIANGYSKMYRYGELINAIEGGGFKLHVAHHNLGSNAYSLLNFHKKA